MPQPEVATHSTGSLRAVIIRADGTVEHLGVIAADHSSRWRRLWWRLVGLPLANRRIRNANRNAARLARKER